MAEFVKVVGWDPRSPSEDFAQQVAEVRRQARVLSVPAVICLPNPPRGRCTTLTVALAERPLEPSS